MTLPPGSGRDRQDRFVVLGLAGARATWFAAIGQWAHAGSIPCDFVKCVSAEQLRVRLRSGRLHSAAVVDGTLPVVDRDLIADVHDAGVSVLVVDDESRTTHWTDLGADSLLREGFGPNDLTEVLRAHAAMVPAGEWRLPSPGSAPPARDPAPLIALCGPGGTGVSTLAIALAQQLAVNRRIAGDVVLADLCLRAEQAVLHDAGDVGPGVQELVDQARTATPTADQVRAHTFDVTERGYALLLGLRRPAAWSALRPRAIAASVAGLRDAFGTVVCDCDADLEGQAEGGSVDVEERTALSRTAVANADVVFVVGAPGLKGVYSLARVISDVADVGVAPVRVVPIFNRARRGPRSRARLSSALAALLPDTVRNEMASAVFLPEREVDASLHNRKRLPAALGDPLVGASQAIRTLSATGPALSDPAARRLEPGELATWPEEVGAS
jgi:hypothetical protein